MDLIPRQISLPSLDLDALASDTPNLFRAIAGVALAAGGLLLAACANAGAQDKGARQAEAKAAS